MSLSADLISEFVKSTKDTDTTKKETIAYGEVVERDGITYVRLDGSDILTPIDKTADVKPGERVTVMIKNHTAIITGNITSPAARTADVETIRADVLVINKAVIDKASINELKAAKAEIELLLSKKASIEELEAERAEIDELIAKKISVEDLEAERAEIDELIAKKVSTEQLEAQKAEINELLAKKATIEQLIAQRAEVNELIANKVSTEQLEAANAKIGTLEADNATVKGKLEANEATIKDLQANKLSAKDADIKYANIDFSNIGKAAMEYLYAESGLIKDVTIGDATITGEIVGVTIRGDRIIGNTIMADKLVIKGEDGIYYKLNIEAGATTSEQVTEEQLQNGLHGKAIIAKTITADKITVTDLVAFGATIGGFNITNKSIYSGVKESADNTTRGIYLDNEGQFVVGDATNFFKYYKQADGTYKLEISANSILLGAKNVETILQEAKSAADDAKAMTDAVTGRINELQNQIDGSITSWFYEEAPTNSNEPAVNWTTPELKNAHLGDLYYETDTGYCYRWMKNGDTYEWGKITDSDVTEALRTAKDAQDTADKKRRVFVDTPTIPYDIGDLWVQGSGGDILRCQNPKSSGSYAAADWIPASKYTDDTTANQAKDAIDNLKIGGRNLFTNSSTFEGPDWVNSVVLPIDGVDSLGNARRWQGTWGGISQLIYAKAGETYTVSATIIGNGIADVRAYATMYAEKNIYGTTISGVTPVTESFGIAPTTEKRYSFTFNITADGYLRARFENGIDGGELYISSMKLEKGNRATDWTPAPEDTYTKTEVDAQLEVLPDSISSRVRSEMIEYGFVGKNYYSNEQKYTISDPNNIASKEETDSSVAYVKYAPARHAPYAKISKVGGLSRKCKNYLNTATAYALNNCTFENGVVRQVNSDTYSYTSFKIQAYNNGSYLRELTSKVVSTLETVYMSFTKTSDYTDLAFAVNGAIIDTGLNFSVADLPNGDYYFSFKTYNLTQGSISWGEMMISKEQIPYEPYFSGLRDAKVTEVKSVGVNRLGGIALAHKIKEIAPNAVLDEANKTIYYSAADVNAKVIYSNFKPNTQYTFFVYGYGSAMFPNLSIKYTDGTETVFGTFGTQDAPNVRRVVSDSGKTIDKFWGFWSSGNTTLEYDKCGIFEGEVGYQAPYDYPYTEHTITIPEEVQNLDGYGLGVDETCYNYVDLVNKKFHRVVKKVTFNGTEGWNTGSGLYYLKVTGMAYASCISDKESDYISARYEQLRFAVTDRYATVTDWKTQLQEWYANGTPLEVVYTLDLPTTEDINIPFTNPINIEGGMTTFENEKKYGVPSEVTYYPDTFLRLDSCPNGFQIAGSQDGSVFTRLERVITGTGMWTVSFYIKTLDSTEHSLKIDVCDSPIQTVTTASNNEWIKYALKFEVTNYSDSVYHFIDICGVDDTYYLFKDFKVEKGEVATDWTPYYELDRVMKETLMTQTEDGWVFNMSVVQGKIDEAKDEVQGEVDDINDRLTTIEKDESYVKIGTYTDASGNTKPSIELSESDSEFKSRITNTEMIFGSVEDGVEHVHTTIDKEKVEAEKIIVKEELEAENVTVKGDLGQTIDNSTGMFVWKPRFKSHVVIDNKTEISNNEYLTKYYIPTTPVRAGYRCRATLDWTPAAGVTHLALYTSGGYVSPIWFYSSGTNRQTTTVEFTMAYYSGRTPDINIGYSDIDLYRFPNNGTVTGNTTIHSFKLEVLVAANYGLTWKEG